jgi:hypothetical protein
MRGYGVGHDLGGGDGDGWWWRGSLVVSIAICAEGVDGDVVSRRDVCVLGVGGRGGRVQGRRNGHFVHQKYYMGTMICA